MGEYRRGSLGSYWLQTAPVGVSKRTVELNRVTARDSRAGQTQSFLMSTSGPKVIQLPVHLCVWEGGEGERHRIKSKQASAGDGMFDMFCLFFVHFFFF